MSSHNKPADMKTSLGFAESRALTMNDKERGMVFMFPRGRRHGKGAWRHVFPKNIAEWHIHTEQRIMENKPL